MAADIVVHQLRKRVNGAELYGDLSFTAGGGGITALFGPNGCGKSTLLNILAGVVPKDGGTVSPEHVHGRDLSYLFQNYRESLLPWRSAYGNLAFPLELRGHSAGEITRRISAITDEFGIDFGLDRYPYQLSGGQQQTLAVIRALVTGPSVLFMDEPFSALDYENTIRMRERLQRYYLRRKPTILFISHDIDEAVHMAGSIIVLSMRPTRIVEVIRNPAPYPRPAEMLDGGESGRIKRRVLDAFGVAARI